MITKKIIQLTDDTIKELSNIEGLINKNEANILNVYDYTKTTFDGFGGAITNASAYNYSLLSFANKQKVLEMLVGETGLHYSIFRLCIGSSDFSTESYTYIEENDYSLKTFSIEKDKLIISFVKDLMKYAKYPLSFFGSCWSMPAFMKTNNDRLHGGKLKKECYQLYAEYIMKFLIAYAEEGINITALTIQNEPKASQTWESCTYSAAEEAEFGILLHNTLKNNNLNVQLYCWDHNKERLVERASETFEKAPNVFSGSALHWYSGQHFDAIDVLRNKFPKMKIIESEFCIAHSFDETEWPYDWEIVNNLRMGINAIVEWNVLLDDKGGPYHDRGNNVNAGCEAPITLKKETLQIEEGNTYKETWMFSHFINQNSSILYTSTFNELIKVSALKKDNDVVINIVNKFKDETVFVYYSGYQFKIAVPKNSVTTVII